MPSASDSKTENAQFKGGKSDATQANEAREWDLEAGFYIHVDTVNFFYYSSWTNHSGDIGTV